MAFIVIVTFFLFGLSCRGEEIPERLAIRLVMATVQLHIPVSDYTATENPEGPGWIVTTVFPVRGRVCTAKYLVRDDTVYAINGWAIACSPETPNVRDARITDCPGGYIPLEILDEQQNEALTESGIPREKRKEIYYELMKYQDDHPGEAEKSYGIIMERYGITGELLNLIMDEGFENRWPQPDYPH